jgi:hypothetical protein
MSQAWTDSIIDLTGYSNLLMLPTYHLRNNICHVSLSTLRMAEVVEPVELMEPEPVAGAR